MSLACQAVINDIWGSAVERSAMVEIEGNFDR